MMSMSQQQECFSFTGASGHSNLLLCNGEEQQISTTVVTIATNQSYNNGDKAPTFAAFEEDDRANKNPSTSQDRTFSSPPPPSTTTQNTPLQWGQRKRSRVPRADNPPVGAVGRRFAKVSRLPPLPLPSGGTHHRDLNLRSSSSSDPHNRAMDEHMNRKRLTHSLEVDNCGIDPTKPPSNFEVVTSRIEMPKIHLTLSRKEKEDDFMLMKGTKLSQRPKKRPKSIEKLLQYIYPGTWLSDLSRGSYEVKEKRCTKKKRLGLKGMETINSDSS